MSNENLMQKASEIEKTAAEVEYKQLAMAAGRGAPAIDYERIKAKYANCAQPLFEPFSRMPESASYQGVIDDLYEAMGFLSHGPHITDPITKQTVGANKDLAAVETAADELSDWDGDAADNFKTNFLDPFPDVASNQFLILGVMKGAAQADQAIWDKAHSNIQDIADGTLEALQNVTSCGSSEVSFTISVFGTLAAVAAIPFTAGASAVVAGLGAAASAAGTAQKAAQTVKGSGGSAQQVIQQMGSAIDELTHQIRERQGAIGDMMTKYADEVDQKKSGEPAKSTPFVAARPDFIGMQGPELTSDEGIIPD